MAPTLKPARGDLIEMYRATYQHWALYVGDDYVVHLAPAPGVLDRGVSSRMSVTTISSVMSVPNNQAVVKKEKLLDAVGTDRWEINNSLDEKYKPRPVSVIVGEALALVGEERSYSPISSNCEHFVTELRYGKAKSRQVRKAGFIAMAVGTAIPRGLGVLGLVIMVVAGYLFGGRKRGIKNTQ